MAPASSKQTKPSTVGPQCTNNGFLGKLHAACSAQLKELGQDLLEIGAFVHGCVQDVGYRLHDSTVPFVEAILESLDLLRRMLSRAERHSRGNHDETKPGDLEHTMPMIFVGHMICLLYSSFVFVYMPAAGLTLKSPLSVLFHATVFMTLASFVRVYMTDPGSVPEGPAWCTQSSPPPHLQERKARGGALRWCRKSLVYKPDRSHYCRVAGRVVLKMDHHCPWVGNTIGFANHKYFLLFLLYATTSCVIANVDVARLLATVRLAPSTAQMLFGSESILVLMSSVLVPFFGFHIWLLSQNMTTIEFCEQSRARSEGDEENTFRCYDIGLLGNLTAVLGVNPLYWLLPVASTPGDGLSFPSQEDGDALSWSGQSENVAGRSSPAQTEDDEINNLQLSEVRHSAPDPTLLRQTSHAASQAVVEDGASTTASDHEQRHHCDGNCNVYRPCSDSATAALPAASEVCTPQHSLQAALESCPFIDSNITRDVCTFLMGMFCKERSNHDTQDAAQGRSKRATVLVYDRNRASSSASSSAATCDGENNHNCNSDSNMSLGQRFL